MEIRFSTARPYAEDSIWKAARDNGCHARIKWATTAAVRFILVTAKDSYDQAPPETQDKVIRALLVLDPEATVRTARATYEGAADFESQWLARHAVHHIDGDPSNNAVENLRLVPIKENRK